MTPEQINRLSASLYRQSFLLKMLQVEHQQFAKTPMPAGIKNAIYRGIRAYETINEAIRYNLPKSKDNYTRVMNQSDEKVFAMLSIIEKLSVLDEADVLRLETEFDNMVKVVY